MLREEVEEAVHSLKAEKSPGVDNIPSEMGYPVQGWHLLSRSPHKDCLSNCINGQSKQDLLVHTISFASKFKLYKSLVTSILPCGCKTWTPLAESE